MKSVVKKEELDEKKVYEMYYDYEEPVKSIVPHPCFALNRAEKEDVVRVTIEVDVTNPLTKIKEEKIKIHLPHLHRLSKSRLKKATNDSSDQPSNAKSVMNSAKRRKHKRLLIFGENLKNLLLQAPMKGQVILGLDPAYRTGCKLAVIDETGKALGKSVILPSRRSFRSLNVLKQADNSVASWNNME